MFPGGCSWPSEVRRSVSGSLHVPSWRVSGLSPPLVAQFKLHDLTPSSFNKNNLSKHCFNYIWRTYKSFAATSKVSLINQGRSQDLTSFLSESENQSVQLFATPWTIQSTEFSRPEYWSGTFPNQGLNPGLLHCKWILYHLSHQGSSHVQWWPP